MTLLSAAEHDPALVARDLADAPHGHEAHAVAVADDENERERRLPGQWNADDDADVALALALAFDAVAERLRKAGSRYFLCREHASRLPTIVFGRYGAEDAFRARLDALVLQGRERGDEAAPR
jgi:hypothetical protein